MTTARQGGYATINNIRVKIRERLKSAVDILLLAMADKEPEKLNLDAVDDLLDEINEIINKSAHLPREFKSREERAAFYKALNEQK